MVDMVEFNWNCNSIHNTTLQLTNWAKIKQSVQNLYQRCLKGFYHCKDFVDVSVWSKLCSRAGLSLAKRNCVDGGLGGWRGGEPTELSSTFPLSFNLLLELNTPKLSQVLSMCVPVSEYHCLIPHNPIVLVEIAKPKNLN